MLLVVLLPLVVFFGLSWYRPVYIPFGQRVLVFGAVEWEGAIPGWRQVRSPGEWDANVKLPGRNRVYSVSWYDPAQY
jgi:hypothetical protein